MFQVKSVVPVVVFAAMSGGCYQGIEGLDLTDEIAEMREVNLNALKLNALKLNALKLNALKLNALKLNHLKLNHLKLNGLQLQGLRLDALTFDTLKLDGSSLGGVAEVNGEMVAYSGEELIGSELKILADRIDENNQPDTVELAIRINDVYHDETYDDIFYYDLSLSIAGDGQWESLCVDENNQPMPIIMLSHYWDDVTGDRIDDPDVVTLACSTAVLAHCVQWGYRPWEESTQCDKWEKGKKNCKTVSLVDYHQACTRMARADYCGDGTPWTVSGTPIDISDHLSPQIEIAETNWPVEAEWNTNGAYCLNDIRQQAWKADGLYPKCPKPRARKLGDCGSMAKHRSLLLSQFEKKKKSKK